VDSIAGEEEEDEATVAHLNLCVKDLVVKLRPFATATLGHNNRNHKLFHCIFFHACTYTLAGKLPREKIQCVVWAA
jgi:hypothetical protein